MTEIQWRVVERKVKDGYSILGKYNSLSVAGYTIGVMKGRHRLQINCLGFDEYNSNPLAYKEIHE